MAVSAKWFGKAFLAMLNKEIDWTADTIKVMLCTSSFTPDQDAMDYQDDITNEVSGTGYTAGGATLANASIGYTGATNVVKLDGDDVTWGSSTITARYAVIVDTTPGSSSTNPVLGYVDFGEDKSSSGGDFTIQWNADGILTITPS